MSSKCPDCPYKVRLRKDGTIGSHLLYSPPHWYSDSTLVVERTWMYYRVRCEGTGKRPKEGFDANRTRS